MHPSFPYVVKREIQFAAKYFARDNYLCDLYLERLLRYETLSPEEQQRQNSERLLQTLRIASQRIARYRGIRRDFDAVDAAQALRSLSDRDQRGSAESTGGVLPEQWKAATVDDCK